MLKGQGKAPWRLITNKLRSYSSAHREVFPSVEHRIAQCENNRAEVSHQPTREQERQMRGFKSIEQIQRFLSVHGPLQNLFRVGRSHLRAVHQRLLRDRVFASWRELTCVCWLKNRLASINLTVPRAGLTTEGELLALTLALTLTYPILKVLGYWILGFRPCFTLFLLHVASGVFYVLRILLSRSYF